MKTIVTDNTVADFERRLTELKKDIGSSATGNYLAPFNSLPPLVRRRILIGLAESYDVPLGHLLAVIAREIGREYLPEKLVRNMDFER
jgi:hypothetical protein